MKNDLINQIEVKDVSDALDILKAAKASMSVDGWFILGNRHGGGYKFNPKSGGMYTY